jgi:WD40 repeat protein
MDASSSGATRSASFTSNRNYVAFAKTGTIYVGKLDAGLYERRCSSLRPHLFGLHPILALSPLRTNLLAISIGSRTSIWDVKNDLLIYTIYASERSVTSTAWSHHNIDILALGHIDGHISVWDLGHLTKPRHVWSAGSAQCHYLAWSLAAPSTLAACCGQTISIWNHDNPCDNAARRRDLQYQADRNCGARWYL